MKKWDGFDEAYIGAGYRCGSQLIAIYDVNKMCNLLVKRDGMTPDEAIEYVEFNCMNAWIGDDTPYIVLPDYMVDSFDDEPEQTER